MNNLIAPILAAILAAWFLGDAEIAHPHLLLLAIIFLIAFSLTQAHLKRRDKQLPLTAFLENGGLDRFYHDGLTWALDRLDRVLIDPKQRMQEEDRFVAPDSSARAWNWLAYDRILLVAVVYPFLLPVLFWIVDNTPVRLGNLIIVDAAASWWQRPIVVFALVGMATFRKQAHFLAKHFRKLTSSVSLGIGKSSVPFEPGVFFVRLVLIATFGAAFIAGFSDAGAAVAGATIGMIAGALTIASAGVSAGNGALAIAVFLAVAGTFSIATVISFTTVMTMVFIAELTVYRLRRRGSYHLIPQSYMVLSAVLLALLMFGASSLAPTDRFDRRPLLLFLGLLPLTNAVWDFLSLGLTRWCLRKSLLKSPLGWLPALFRPLAFSLLDLAGALVCLAGLIATLLLGVGLLNHVAPNDYTVLSLTRLFVDLRQGDAGPNMTWIYLMVFSTLLPTALHIALFVLSLFMRFPSAFGRTFLVNLITNANDGDDREIIVCAIMAAWATLWAGLIVLMWVFVIPVSPGWHERVLGWIISQAEHLCSVLGLL